MNTVRVAAVRVMPPDAENAVLGIPCCADEVAA
jgi:hypothetical protein